MKSTYSNSLDEKRIRLFESMYNFFHSERHPYMHSTDSDLTTTIVASYEDALDKLNEIIHNMKVSYIKFSE